MRSSTPVLLLALLIAAAALDGAAAKTGAAATHPPPGGRAPGDAACGGGSFTRAGAPIGGGGSGGGGTQLPLPPARYRAPTGPRPPPLPVILPWTAKSYTPLSLCKGDKIKFAKGGFHDVFQNSKGT